MSDSRTRIWFALFVVVVFCAGLGGGVILDRAIGRPAFFDRGSPRGALDFPGPGGMRRGGRPPRLLLDRLASELDLSADQRSKIEAVLIAHRASVENVQREVRDRFDAAQRSLHDDIRKVLTPEQQEKFDKTQRERGRFGRRGPPR